MWITPNYQDTDFSWPLSIGDKITVFLDRTNGWQLDIADQCINGIRGLRGEFIVKPVPLHLAQGLDGRPYRCRGIL